MVTKPASSSFERWFSRLPPNFVNSRRSMESILLFIASRISMRILLDDLKLEALNNSFRD